MYVLYVTYVLYFVRMYVLYEVYVSMSLLGRAQISPVTPSQAGRGRSRVDDRSRYFTP